MSNEVKFKYGDASAYERKVAEESGVDASTLYFVTKDIETENGVDFGGTIYRGNDALGTTCADHLKTTADITVAGLSGQLGAGIANGDTIPAGTSLQEILVKLLSKELYPSAATKPSVDISGEKSFGLVEVGSTVTIPAVSMAKSVGKFNASYTSPAQPTPEITWSNEKMTATVSGFGGVTIAAGTTSLAEVEATVALGSNSVTYTADASYTAPSNSPKTNLGNDTTKTGEDKAEGSATWSAGNANKSNVKTTATGVYPIYTNGVTASTTDATAAAMENLAEPVTGDGTKLALVAANGAFGVSFAAMSKAPYTLYVPNNWTIKSAYAINGTTAKYDVNCLADFIQNGTTTRTVQGNSVEYKVYEWAGTEGANRVKFTLG